MKIRRQHLIIAAVVILGITFLTIGVLSQKEPSRYYSHSLRNWQESDAIAGYPIAIPSDDDKLPTFRTTTFQPNLSTMSAMEIFRLPTAHGFIEPPADEGRAAGTGLVLFAGPLPDYNGHAVLLGHRLPDDSIIQTFYAGLTDVSVKVGQHVARKELLGKGPLFFEIREGIAIDLAYQEIEGFLLNSPASPAPPNRLSPEPFFAEHGLAKFSPDPLAVIQENEDRATRQKIGIED